MEADINLTRKIGIEIEIVVPIIGRGESIDVQSLIAQVLTNQGMPAVARGYTQQDVPDGCLFTVEHDMSLRDESRYAGLRWSRIELKTAAVNWPEIERVLPPALEIIKYVGARVNVSCGLHVHHHLPEALERPTVVRNLQHFWWRFHEVLFGLVSPSRKTNQYCRPPTEDQATLFDKVRTYEDLCDELDGCSRYGGLNFVNLANRYRMTVEWRFHSGTTDWSKIRAWVLATQRWVEHAASRSCHHRAQPAANTRAGLNALLLSTGLKPNSRIYRKIDKELRGVGRFLLRRWKHFNQPEESKKWMSAA